MTRGVGVWPVLAPAGYPAVDQAGVTRKAWLGPYPEPLRDSRPESFKERVTAFDQTKHNLRALGLLKVHGDRAAPPVEDAVVRTEFRGGVNLGGPIDADHVRA